MTLADTEKCSICSAILLRRDQSGNLVVNHCPRCGPWMPWATRSGMLMPLGQVLGDDRQGLHRRARASHVARRAQSSSPAPGVGISVDTLQEWRLDDPLPAVQEQIDSLLLWCGARQPNYLEWLSLPLEEVSAWIGAPMRLDSPRTAPLVWLIQQYEVKKHLDSRENGNGTIETRFTVEGWKQLDLLKRQVLDSRRAFMAMKFGDETLNNVVEHCFKPAVSRTGFDLRILSDHQPAGLIDDQLRSSLRTARFVIADITHSNLGAYWEAGFAEGLGLPVIYTCRDAEWNDRASHFDTNHLVTIIWNENNLAEAGRRLTATIRATLPAEAVQAD